MVYILRPRGTLFPSLSLFRVPWRRRNPHYAIHVFGHICVTCIALHGLRHRRGTHCVGANRALLCDPLKVLCMDVMALFTDDSLWNGQALIIALTQEH